MPFCKVKNPFEKLLLLRHPDEWFIWNNAYDSDGVFQWSLVKPIEELISLTPPGARQKSVRPLIVKKNKQNLVTTVPQPLSILAPPRVQLTIDELLSSNVARMPPPQGAFQQPVTRSVQQPATKKRSRSNRGDDSSPCPSFDDFTATTSETLSGMVAHSGSVYSGVSSAITQPVGFVTSSSLTYSVKGIQNLGNTCYLAVVVQVLLLSFLIFFGF
jgi:hypothetical protein